MIFEITRLNFEILDFDSNFYSHYKKALDLNTYLEIKNHDKTSKNRSCFRGEFF